MNLKKLGGVGLFLMILLLVVGVSAGWDSDDWGGVFTILCILPAGIFGIPALLVVAGLAFLRWLSE
jgi:uncharacterized membrane protein SpoIIM required for sporulation